jgi:NAD(P)-dependent dehydrogenase (short-subunit alcohol dehydrogenase family)
MACDLVDYGITVNVVAPGWIRSPMSMPFQSEEILSGVRRYNPMVRVGETSAMRSAGCWRTRRPRHGSDIPVDGGQNRATPDAQDGRDRLSPRRLTRLFAIAK